MNPDDTGPGWGSKADMIQDGVACHTSRSVQACPRTAGSKPKLGDIHAAPPLESTG